MEKVDVIIMGGGLAGLSCAYELSDSGMTVLVLERGDFSGSKNVTGGRIYVTPIKKYLPEIIAEAPFERHVVKEVITVLDDVSVSERRPYRFAALNKLVGMISARTDGSVHHDRYIYAKENV